MSAYIRWGIAGTLVAISALVRFCQFGGMVQATFRRRKDQNAGGYSIVPLIGGICGMVGCFVAPSETIQRLWWIPPVVDPGCVLLFTMTSVFLLWYLTFGRKRQPTPPTR